jgi:two-component sensor histidine kinase
MEEQAALYRFTDRLYRSETVGDIYEAALDGIVAALGCRRASILLFDNAGVMRFVAWRGLSDAYRRAVEGHTPWRPATRDPQPISVDNIEQADIEEALKQTIRGEGIAALAFIPLVAGGRTIGKFMTYYETPHAFSEAEVELSLTIARQLVFAVERMRARAARRRAEAELRQNEERERARAAELQAIMEAVPALIWIARDAEGREVSGNQMGYEFLRLDAGANPSLSAPAGEAPTHFQILAEGRVLEPHELAVQRAARGEVVRNFEEEVRFDDGTAHFLLGNATPLRDSAGNVAGSVAAFMDITDRKQAEAQRDLLVAELSHRVKNTLATVISIAQQSFSRGQPADEARQSFQSRIRALAQTHSRLAEASWSGVSLETILLDELAPYRNEGNVRMSGPKVRLTPRCSLTLGMAIHELATNAAKYGALSSPAGSVRIAWEISPKDNQLAIRWVEIGGPAVAPPARSGFGRLLLERALASDLKGDVRLDFAESGLKCDIEIPVAEHVARAN